MPRRVPDITKIQELIGFRSTKDLSDILRMVIDYYRELQTDAVLPHHGARARRPIAAIET